MFDLDLTLWECGGTWIDTCYGPPFQLVEPTNTTRTTTTTRYALSVKKEKCMLYDDCWIILEVLMELKSSHGIQLAIASRTQEPKWAKQLLQVLQIDHWFEYHEIYPSSKTRHFRQLQEKSKVDYSEMIFFDDELRNVKQVNSELGVVSVLVERGLTVDDFTRGLLQFHI